jgi:putative flippase GtrA
VREELARLVRFAAVGASNTAVTFVAFGVLVRLGSPAAAASALAFALGAANGYRLNRRWTFRAARRGMRTAVRYVGVQSLGAALSAGGIAVVGAALGLHRLGAELVVIPGVTLVSYALVRRFVFGAASAPSA